MLGGVDIPHERGLLGHSDADVLIHALCDALLGAVADGDIGLHFPDKDPQWKNADSTVLLGRVVERLARAGWRILNTDATIYGGSGVGNGPALLEAEETPWMGRTHSLVLTLPPLAAIVLAPAG